MPNIEMEILGPCNVQCEWDGPCRTCPITIADWEKREGED